MAFIEQSDEDRFWAKVNIKSSGKCWEWQGAKNKTGYGVFRVDGKNVLAHRWVCEPVPEGTCVLHACDSPSCVNPYHLFLGSQKDKVVNMVEKGRDNWVTGERNGQSKLTEKQVRAIRKDNRSLRKIASDYGVNDTLIGMIKRRERWSYLP